MVKIKVPLLGMLGVTKMTKEISTILHEICGSVSGSDLKKAIKRSDSYVSQIRAGALIPTDDVVFKIATKYAPDRLGEMLTASAISRIEKQKSFNTEESRVARAAMVAYVENSATSNHGSVTKLSGRTMLDFPSAFQPLTVITGDKREDGLPHISVADFGVYTATPADMRWLCNLELPADTVIHVDKHGLLPNENAADEKFGNVNLLIIGSPAANHVARMTNQSAIFRFNYTPETESLINSFLEEARKQRNLTALSAYHEQNQKKVRATMHNLFTGGIIDPTNHETYRAAEFSKIVMETQYDFGVLTFCANPFYERICKKAGKPHDYKYVAIMAAGIHHPSTAHSVRFLGKTCREKNIFGSHPYGGVLRVTLDMNIPAFGRRVEDAEVQWEDEVDEENKMRVGGRNQKDAILRGFNSIEHLMKTSKMRDIQMDPTTAAMCIKLIENL